MKMQKFLLMFSFLFIFSFLMVIGCSTPPVIKAPGTLPPIVKEYKHITLWRNHPGMVNTGIHLNGGDLYSILATGSVDLWPGGPSYHDIRPEHGWPFMMRIGNEPYKIPLWHRDAFTTTSDYPGELFLGIRCCKEIDDYGNPLRPDKCMD